jgi:glucose/arabinose dehydrogenase
VKRLAALALVVVASACAGNTVDIAVAPNTTLAVPLPVPPPPASGELVGLTVAEVDGDFEEPTFVGAPPGDDRLFVVEKRGVIKVRWAGEWHTYLDLSEFVGSDGPERGMVGLAFHPDFAANGRLFVYYTNRSGDSRVVEFGGRSSPAAADPSPPEVVLAVDQPQEWHNGGALHFGPDGYLWLSLGDGGGVSDTYRNGQDPETVLGALLRIDVNAGAPYAIPPGNPFIDGGGAPEVWAFGLRNPFSFSVDPVDRLVYIADVGQERWEEIDVVPLAEPGHNFGWPITEGTHCYVDILLEPEPESVPCSKEGLTDPVLAYPHGPGCAIIGGPLYRGHDIPELYGHYLYSDWCAGWIRSMRFEDGSAVDTADWPIPRIGRINGVGTDGNGEPYIVTTDGGLYALVPRR